LTSHDVIALTEITSGVGKARVRRLASMFSICTPNNTWSVHFSEESQASSSSRGSKEMHAVVYNSNWNLLHSNTLHRIESGGSITHMGHAPMVVQFKSTTEQPSLPSFSLIIAHLAPSNRSRTTHQEAKGSLEGMQNCETCGLIVLKMVLIYCVAISTCTPNLPAALLTCLLPAIYGRHLSHQPYPPWLQAKTRSTTCFATVG